MQISRIRFQNFDLEVHISCITGLCVIGQPGNKLNFSFFFWAPSPPLPIIRVGLCFSGAARGKDFRIRVGAHLPNLVFGEGGGIMVQNKLKLSLLTGGCLLRTAPRNLMHLSQADARHSSSVDRWMSSEDCSAEFSAPGSRLPHERLSTLWQEIL